MGSPGYGTAVAGAGWGAVEISAACGQLHQSTLGQEHHSLHVLDEKSAFLPTFAHRLILGSSHRSPSPLLSATLNS